MSTRIEDLSGILLKDVRWSVTTAGPSPNNNERTEVFFLGCDRAMAGVPCKGCFNQSTWDNSKAEFSHDPVKMAAHINKYAPNKYITIGGGEPTAQLENLVILCEELKKYGFHIIVYTWKELRKTSRRFREMATIYILESQRIAYSLQSATDKDKMEDLLNTIDILIDGEYKEDQRLYDFKGEDGLTNSIGSANQGIYDCNKNKRVLMNDIKSLRLDEDNNLIIEERAV